MPSGHLCRVVTEAICFPLKYFGELSFWEDLLFNISTQPKSESWTRKSRLLPVLVLPFLFDTSPRFHTQFLALGNIRAFSLFANTNIIMDHSKMFLGIIKRAAGWIWCGLNQVKLIWRKSGSPTFTENCLLCVAHCWASLYWRHCSTLGRSTSLL